MWIFVVLFTIALTFPFLWQVFSDIKVSLVDEGGLQHERSQDYLTDMQDKSAGLYDGIFVIALMGFWLFMIGSSFFVRTHPWFFIMGIFVNIAFFGAVVGLGNAYADFSADGLISNAVAQMPIMNFVISNILLVFLGFLATTGIALYAGMRS